MAKKIDGIKNQIPVLPDLYPFPVGQTHTHTLLGGSVVTPGVTQSSEVKEVDRLRCDVTWGSVMWALMYASVFCGVSGVVELSLSPLSGEVVLGVGWELDSIVFVGICLSFCPFLCVFVWMSGSQSPRQW